MQGRTTQPGVSIASSLDLNNVDGELCVSPMKRKTPSSKPVVPYPIKTRSQTEAESRSAKEPAIQETRGSTESPQPAKKTSRVSRTHSTIREEKPKRENHEMTDEGEKAKDSPKTATDKDEEEENSTPNPPSTAANTALQGLMRRLGGAALEELLPQAGGQPPLSLSTLMEGRSKLKTLLQGLKSDNESQQLESMMELCDYLSMGTEESLAGFSIDSFVPAIVNLLNMEHNPDLMLLACRGLAHLLEALPAAGSSIVLSGAVPSLCSKLLSIEYIDLAEQSLQALEKLSLEHPASVLRAGGLMAVLSYLDFFPTGVQRVAVATAANICRQIPPECFETVADAIPMLTNLLQYSDQKVVESTIVCFSRLIDSFSDYESKLLVVTTHGLLPHMVRLISGANTNVVISPGTYTLVVHLLATLCQGAPAVSYILMQEGVVPTLQVALTGPNGASGTSALSRPAQQIFELLSLINELLPQLPVEIANLMSATGKPSSGFSRERVKKKKPEESEKPAESEPDPREKMVSEHPELLVNFGKSLFVVLVDMFTSTVNPSVRYKCLSAITKILYFDSADMLKDLLESFAFSSFVAGLLASRDNAVVAVALKMAEIMMEKLPGIFSKYFRREGVVYEVERLTKLEPLHFAPVPLNTNPVNSVPQLMVGSPSSGPSLSRFAQHASLATSPGGSGHSDHSIPIPSTPANVPPPLSSSPSSTSFFFVGSPASVQTTTTSTLTTHDDMKTFVCTQARLFHEKHFKRQLGDAVDSSSTDQLLHLQKLSSMLGKEIDDDDYTEATLLSEISNMLTTPEGVSTFEFLRSNLSENLLAYLTKSGSNDGEDEELQDGQNGTLSRSLNFILTFMGLPGIAALTNSSIPLVSSSSTTSTTTNKTTGATTTTVQSQPASSGKSSMLPISVLVSKLHDSLNKLERFPVLINDTPGTASGLKYLTQPFKLKLLKDGDNELIKDYSANVVLVEPLATIAAIEDFLLPKIKRDSSDIAKEEAEKEKEKEEATKEKEKEKPKEKEEEKSKKQQKKKLERAPSTKRSDEDAALKKSKDKKADTDSEKEGGSSVAESEDMDFYDDDEYDNYEDDDDEVLPPPSDHPESPDKVHDLKLDPTGTTPPIHSRYLSSTPTKPIPSSSPLSHTARSLLSSLPPATPPSSIPSPTSSSSSSAPSTPNQSTPSLSNYKLAFYVHDQKLPPTTTIFQAVQKLTRDLTNPDTPQPVHRMWEAVHTLRYRLVPIDSTEGAGPADTDAPAVIKDPNSGVEPLDCAALLQFLQDDHPFSVATSDTTYEILALLRVINQFNLNWPTLYHKGFLRPVLPSTDLINNRLTAKLMRQLQDPLTICSGALPPWCKQLVVACPFLFPFECRRQYFYSTSFGIARALQRNEGLRANGDRAEFRIGRIQRQKVRISRARLLESAVKVMDLYGKNKAILEVEYFAEVGTGLGPTLEFFTLVSREIQKKSLGIWWDENTSTSQPETSPTNSTTTSTTPTHPSSEPISIPRPNAPTSRPSSLPKSSPVTTTTTTTTTSTSTITTTNLNFDDEQSTMDVDQRGPASSAPPTTPSETDFVYSPGGLFPAPLRPGTPDYERKVELFKFLGTFLAKSFLDSRLLDLPLSAPFLKWVTGQDLRFEDLHTVSPALGKSLEGLVALCREKRALEKKWVGSVPAEQKRKQVEALRYRGASVEDLCLDFTLPGKPEWDLKADGANISVTIHNLEEYVNLVAKTYLITGVRAQLQAFQEGFNLVFPLENLRLFTVGELETLICGAVTGSNDDWSIESLQDNTKADHGFSSGSQAVQFLYSVMAEFNETERRQFLQFVTGSPRLPISGFKGLTPKLTIVKKHHDPPLTPDHYLPSVMSCTNYLKLPDYSSKEVLKQRLLYAIVEGHSSFHLS